MAKRGLIENKERREGKKRENQTRPPDTVYHHCQLMSSASSMFVWVWRHYSCDSNTLNKQKRN